MALVKCSFPYSSSISIPISEASNIRNGDGRTILLPFWRQRSNFLVCCASGARGTQKGCANFAHVIFRNNFFQRMMAVVNVNVKQWIVLMHFFPCHFANPCNVVLPDTQTQTRRAIFFCDRPSLPCAKSSTLRMARTHFWAAEACAFACVTKAQACTIAHLHIILVFCPAGIVWNSGVHNHKLFLETRS